MDNLKNMTRKLEAGMSAQESWGMNNSEVKEIKKKANWKNRRMENVSKCPSSMFESTPESKIQHLIWDQKAHTEHKKKKPECLICNKEKCIDCSKQFTLDNRGIKFKEQGIQCHKCWFADLHK